MGLFGSLEYEEDKGHFWPHRAPFRLNKMFAAVHEDLKFRTSESRALKWGIICYMKPSVHFHCSKITTIRTIEVNLLQGKCTEGFIYNWYLILKLLAYWFGIWGPYGPPRQFYLDQTELDVPCQTRQKMLTEKCAYYIWSSYFNFDFEVVKNANPKTMWHILHFSLGGQFWTPVC